jgi:hypothetical protein
VGRYIVSTPASDHTGIVGGVHFMNGTAEVDDATHGAALAYMRAAGYVIRDADQATDVVEPDVAEFEVGGKPKKNAPVGEWRAYAQTKGLSAEEAEGLTKNQLVERFDEEDAS